MSEIRENSTRFAGYEYKEVTAQGEASAMYLDCYPSFGWVLDEEMQNSSEKFKFVFKRERRIINRMELTRLQRHFEACMDEIAVLEASKASGATIIAILIGLIGTAFIAGGVFAAVHTPPMYLLMTLLAVPGFIGWTMSFFAYQKLLIRRTKIVTELVDQKYDEIYEICKQGERLLN